MKRLQVFVVGMLGVLSLFATGDAWGQKKDKKAPPKNEFPAEAKDYQVIQRFKELTGTIQNADGKSLTLRLDIPHVEKNPTYKPPAGNANNNNASSQMQHHMQRLNQLQGNLARAKTPQQAQSAKNAIMHEQQAAAQQMARISQQMANSNNKNNNSNNGPYKVVMDHKDFDLDFADKMVVRKMFLETGYDDKGNLIEYTKEKIAKLKGDDPKLPGLTAKFDEIQPGVIAKVMLIPVANAAKTKSKDDDTLVGAVDKPTIRLVLLLQEKKDAPSSGKDKGKSK